MDGWRGLRRPDHTRGQSLPPRRRWRPRLPDVWHLLSAAIVVLSVTCAVLIFVPPRQNGEPAGAGSTAIFVDDVENAPSTAALRGDPHLVPVEQQLAVDAQKLLSAKVVTAVNITRGDTTIYAKSVAPASGFRMKSLPVETARPASASAGTQDFRIEVSVAEPADLHPLRRSNSVLRILILALGALAAGGLWLSRRRHAEQEQITLIDPLTGVGNRRLLQRLSVRALRNPDAGRHHALLLVDIDHFKALNDTFGHAHGDLALRRLAESLQEAVRPGDHVIRLGGDEFAVLLENVPGPPAATTVVQHVLTRVREHLPDLEISGGGAIWPDDALDLTGLAHVADQAMYADKQRRKNTVDVRTVAPSGPAR